MQKREIKMVEVNETVYCCDACNKRIGLKDDLVSYKCTQLFTSLRDRDFVVGCTYRAIDRSYLLCDECYQAFHSYLTKIKPNKTSLASLLHEED